MKDPDFGDETFCRTTLGPAVSLQAHSAPLGISFFPLQGWPKDYQLDLLVAFHGSWNRSQPTGYKIVRIFLENDGKYVKTEDFISGFLTADNLALGRPADILIVPNGRIYISDDKTGVIYLVERIP